MALGKSRIKQEVKGGGLLKIRQLSPSASDTFVDVGWLGGTDIEDSHDMIDGRDERGLLFNRQSGAETVTIKTKLKQSSKDEIDLVTKCKDQFYEGYYKVLTQAGAYVQEYSFFIMKIKPGVVLSMQSATERTIEVEITLLAVGSETTIVRAPTDYNITPSTNPYWLMIENAIGSIKGAPTDTAATIWTNFQ